MDRLLNMKEKYHVTLTKGDDVLYDADAGMVMLIAATDTSIAARLTADIPGVDDALSFMRAIDRMKTELWDVIAGEVDDG